MNKKKWLTAAAVCLFAGVILSGSAAFISRNDPERIRSWPQLIIKEKRIFSLPGNTAENTIGNENPSLQEQSKRYASADDFSLIAADISYGNIRIEKSDHFEIRTKNLPENGESEDGITFSWEIEDQILKLEVKQEDRLNISIPAPVEITVSVPGDLTSLNICTDAGAIALDHLTAEDVTLQTDAGGISIDTLHGLLLNAKTDAGAIDCEDVSLDEAVLKTDAGNIHFSGYPAQLLQVSADAGNITAVLPDAEVLHDASVQMKTDIGSLSLNGHKIDGQQYEHLTHHHPEISLQTDVGNISLN